MDIFVCGCDYAPDYFIKEIEKGSSDLDYDDILCYIAVFRCRKVGVIW